MNQQINLFQPIFRQERKILSFSAFIQINLIVVVALVGLFSFGFWKTQQLSLEAAELKKQQNTYIAQLNELTQKVAKWKEKYHSQEQLVTLQAELQAHQFITQLFDSEFRKRALGFSVYFDTFSNQVVKGLWISGFKVSDGGKAIDIAGGALKPEMVPEFINRLSVEPQLAGTNFGVLKLDRKEQNRQWIEFSLSSKERITNEVEP